MVDLVRALLGASPLSIVLAVAAVGLLVAMIIMAPVFKLDAKAWFMRRRGVPQDKIAAWALSEAEKDRRNPLVEIIEAFRGKSGSA